MEWWWLLAVIVTFQTFSTSKSSMVTLKDGGYDDIVIAINPGIPENVQLIEKLKDLVKEATEYIFKATQQRLFIRSAKILIPMTWSKQNYTKRKIETYDKADVIIANPYLKYGDDPYTLQYGGCGEPGKYIHLTPNFLLNDTLLSVYGPRGRVFVHEWAHLRWGVFDEYNLEKPFYISTDLKVEATRCSREILGVYVKKTDQCQGGSCNMRACNFDSNTGLYEEGCLFVLDKNQFVKHSIMYLQSLPSVFEFCNSSNHNIEAPTLQNRMCNSRSTWDVIINSSDLNSTSPMANTSIPVPVISLIQFRDRVITLVLDVSGSMIGTRIQRLYQAAEIFVMQIIEAGSYVGIVLFSYTGQIATPLIQVKNDQDREALKSFLPKSASGGTNICEGVRKGIMVNKGLDGSSDGTEIVLLSDGEDNYNTSLCYNEIYNSGAMIHFKTLGPLYTKSLEDVVKKTGGLQFSAKEDFDTTSLIDAFTGLLFENGNISQQSIQLESKASKLKPKDCLNGSIFIDSTIGNNTFFVVTWQSESPNVRLQDPTGKIYTSVNFTSDPISKSSRLEIPGTAERGEWDYSLCNTLASEQSIGIIVNSKAADENVPPITVKAHMNTDKNNFPYPMVVYASVSQGMLPVKGANVTAAIEPVSGAPTYLELLDNGAGADIVKNDGVYSRYFTAFKVDGRHSLNVRVEGVKGKSRLSLHQSRALYIPGYIENGTITMNPSRATVDDEDGLNVGAFVRTASGGAFEVTNAREYLKPGIFKPEKISDLEAKIENGSISLSWTATGAVLDEGTASSYDLKMSHSIKELRDNFNGSYQVNTTSVIPQQAGSTEFFTFVPENVEISNGTILYFALVAIDDTFQRSDISNIAQAALFIPRTPEPTTTPVQSTETNKITTPSANTVPVQPINPNTDNLNPSVITAIVCSAAVLICIIICVTVCFVKLCKK